MRWMKRLLSLMLLAGVAGVFAGCESDDHDHDPYRVHYGSEHGPIVVHDRHYDDRDHEHIDEHQDYRREYTSHRDDAGRRWDGRDLDHP